MSNQKNSEDKKEQENKQKLGAGLEALVLVPQLGLSLAIPIILGAAAGNWLDKKIGTDIVFFVIFLLLGIGGGIFSAYAQIQRMNKK